VKIGALEKVVDRLKDVPGDVAEFGVFEGENTEHMAKCFKGRRVWAWDTFEGMPDDGYIQELDKSDPPGKWKPHKDPRPHFESLHANHGYNIIPVSGLFSVTIPNFELTHPDVKFAFVHVDCDHYMAYQRVLAFITPRMSPGGIVKLDDYGCCAGAKKAADEWLAAGCRKLESGEYIYF
jgi:O-methyltransferase